MKTNSEIRQDALALMKGNWSSAIAVIVVLYLVIYGISIVTTTIVLLYTEIWLKAL